ncbi:hypothetical protein AB0J84_32040, partial [Micromonospora arborensis]|uniref:hypothetical protein n=1 Tax=Micromonospora arborensis TaxID=2116518 RepID=UPI003439F37E
VTPDNEVDDSLGPVLDRYLVTRVLGRLDATAWGAAQQQPGPEQGAELIPPYYTAPDGTRYRWQSGSGREPLPGMATQAHVEVENPAVATRLLASMLDRYRQAMGPHSTTTELVRRNVERLDAATSAGHESGSGRAGEVSTWMMSLPEAAPPSVEGVQAAVALFAARYRQWASKVLAPQVATAEEGPAAEAARALATIEAELNGLRGSLEDPTPQARQGMWDRFVQLARDYGVVRSALLSGGSLDVVPPSVDELMQAARPAPADAGSDEQVADVQVWMLPSLQVAPPSVEGVQAAVTLFWARYRQWLGEGGNPDLNLGQPTVDDAISQLFTILRQLDELRRALAPRENPTPQTGQRVWDQFVRVVRDYDGLRSGLMLSETQGVVPPSVDELMRSAPTAPTGAAGDRTPMSLAPEAIPHDASTIGITQVGFQPSIFDKVSALVPRNVRWRVLGEHEALPASLEDFLGSD